MICTLNVHDHGQGWKEARQRGARKDSELIVVVCTNSYELGNYSYLETFA
jgi:hypothetical protein